MYSRLELVISIVSVLNVFMPMTMSVDPNCDYYQELVVGQQYYIYNKEYPNYYPPSTNCRWTGKSPTGTSIILDCETIDLPFSRNCQGDRLLVTFGVNAPKTYCGRTTFTIVGSNSLIVELFARSDSPGGRFLCSLTAIQTARPNTCNCGWRHETRIVGGHDTGINEYPSMAALVDASTTDAFCGASIISDRYAVTAAHCLLHKQPRDLGLLVGDYNLTSGSDTAAAALYALIVFQQHPFYNQSTFQNDIAVVKTRLKIQFSAYVGPVCLPFRYTAMNFYRYIVTALGWGFVDFSGPKSDTLKAVDLSVISNVQCAAAIPDPISAGQICTYMPMKDTCLSDSGGPLLWQDSRTTKLQLVGIISYGLGCASTKPGVNTRVTSYLSWIATVTSDAVYCIK